MCNNILILTLIIFNFFIENYFNLTDIKRKNLKLIANILFL